MYKKSDCERKLWERCSLRKTTVIYVVCEVHLARPFVCKRVAALIWCEIEGVVGKFFRTALYIIEAKQASRSRIIIETFR